MHIEHHAPRPAPAAAAEEDLRQQVKAALKSRALLIAAILDELTPEMGEEKAEALLTRALHKRGFGAGKRFFADCAPANFDGLKTRFIQFLPDHGGLFDIETRCSADGLDVKFHSCPIKEAYEEVGLPPQRMAALLRISGAVDVGTFEGAGFAIDNDTWQPGGNGCCHLHIRKR